eukprot:1963231-Pyramimonas_sp.AAC.1
MLGQCLRFFVKSQPADDVAPRTWIDEALGGGGVQEDGPGPLLRLLQLGQVCGQVDRVAVAVERVAVDAAPV